jgi:branched-chain amino acid aminotransferase
VSTAFQDGTFRPLDEVNVHISTHAFSYGTSVFEGIRAYWDEESQRLLVFRPREHLERLAASARLFGMKLELGVEEICAAIVELLRRDGVRQNTYVRPVLFKSSRGVGLWRHDLEDSLVIYHQPMADYHPGCGVRCCISSWRRADGNSAPVRAKIGGMYAALALARHEATVMGYDEAITLTAGGHVAEATAENIFLVVGGQLVTPDLGSDLLAGITRATLIDLAHSSLRIDVIERPVNRSELYTADEVLLCGTAAEVTPVLEIDGHVVGTGRPGKTSMLLRRLYLEAATGRRAERLGWCLQVACDEVSK